MRHWALYESRFIQSLMLVFLGPFMACGCTPSDTSPVRFQVSGMVKFHGAPVPTGTIRFIPDAARGNSGPVGYASISNGHFDTAAKGKGAVGGHQKVIISGFDGIADVKADMPYGRPLFPEYQTEVELPMHEATFNFDVPSPPQDERSAQLK